jgi:hypothetical protein
VRQAKAGGVVALVEGAGLACGEANVLFSANRSAVQRLNTTLTGPLP